MSRRVFVMLLVGAVIFPTVWPFAARAQQAVPRIGYLSPGSGAAGLVASLARPGANISGTSSMSAGIIGKSLDLLKEAVPTAHRMAVLWNPSNAVFQGQMLRQARVAARRLGVQRHPFGVGDPDEFDRTFTAMTADGADALLVLADPMFILHQAAIVDFARRNRLPAMYGVKEYAAAGGLMAYAPKMADQFRHAAGHVDKILRGAKPGDLPIEQPTEFEFIINLETAKSLGLAIPSALLARADEVIE